jgi:transaldolase
MPSKPQSLYLLGQSLWYDNIERRLLNNGELEAMIRRGDIYGVTSNPSIFDKAISESADYDDELRRLAGEGKEPYAIFEDLAVADIRAACDLFAGLYESTNGGDGFVSIEVHPDLANDTAATIEQAQHLWDRVARPNLMVKIPGTRAGLPAIRQSIAAGININITLIFSRARYAEVIDAYLSGLEDRVGKSEPIENIASVASFFVSRIDSKIDGWLDKIVQQGGDQAELASNLKGEVAIANAVLAYQLFKNQFDSQRFDDLKAFGAKLQRPLWASTSTKDPAYPDTLYVDELIGPHTVNTVPPKTLEAFKDHGNPQFSIEADVAAAERVLADLESLGLSLDQATDEIEVEGVAAFSKSIQELMESIEEKQAKVAS